MPEVETTAFADDIVACRELSKTYSRNAGGKFRFWRHIASPSVPALKNVSLDLGRGEILGIQGPSGSGKSTLLHHLGGLDTPTDGRVQIGGEIIRPNTSQSALTNIRRTSVGIVFQRFHLLPGLSAPSNVALPLVQLGQSKGSRRERAEQLLTRAGLEDRMSHKPYQLSGGEQQRVAIARAMATDPDLLLADEPTGELDSDTADRILDIFTDLAKDRAVIIATHDEKTASIANRIVRLHDGRVI